MSFLDKANALEQTFGTFLGLNSPIAAEIAGISQADWVLLDLEHGGGGEEQLGPTVVAARSQGIPTLVRVESKERIRIGRALDAGAEGVMIPRLETVIEVEDVVHHMSYPPFGDRGVATYNRSAKWGNDLSALSQKSLAACIIQIETLKALNAVDEIASIVGVEVLFVPRDFKSEKFIGATNKVLEAAKRHHKVAGILAADIDTAAVYRDRGFKFIAIGSDATLLAGAISNAISQLKK
jgi:4-hydroxy-2-oxoheptanedioate aldolase